jgi:hypothetical protein
MSEGFDWDANTVDQPVRTQMGVAVYRNANDDIVIRQEARGDDDDPFIVLHPEHVTAVIRALEVELTPTRGRTASEASAKVTPLKPGPSSAA